MSEVTAPIMTDATGQSIDGKLNSLLGKMDNLAAAFQPNASGIVYSNTTSGLTGDDVQEAIDEMAADVSEIKQSLSDLGDATLLKSFTGVDTTGVTVDFTPYRSILVTLFDGTWGFIVTSIFPKSLFLNAVYHWVRGTWSNHDVNGSVRIVNDKLVCSHFATTDLGSAEVRVYGIK